MKAVIQERYGPPEQLRLRDVELPAVGDGDVRLEVRAAGVNPLDWHLVRGTPLIARAALGLPGPKVTRRGVDVAGRVEAVGKDVQDLRPATRFSAGARALTPSMPRRPRTTSSSSRAP